MPSSVQIVTMLLAGFGLGLFFFWGLWRTVRMLPASRHPALLAVASFWARAAVVAAGLALISSRSWVDTVACLIGFAAARMVLIRWIPSRRWTVDNGDHS